MVVAVALGLLMVCVGGMSTANATSGAATGTGSVWAYGVVRTVDVSGHNAIGGYEYQGSALIGFSAILNESTSVGGNFSLSVVRTMGVAISILYCIPNCHLPLFTASLHYRAWENTSAIANLTTTATVVDPTGSAPALGLRSESGALTAGVRESTQYANRSAVLLSRELWANLSASETLALHPALGLIPLNLTGVSSWNATSAFTASGGYNWSWALDRSGSTIGPHPLWNGSSSGPKTLNRSGNVTVFGNFTPGSTVRLAGATYDAINLTVEGMFVLRDGVVLVPAGANLFSGASTPWSSGQFGAANVSYTHLDVTDHVASGRLGLVAAASMWRASTSVPALAIAGPSSGPAIATDSATPTYVQAEPESPQQAQADQKCLASGIGCPTLPASPRGPFGVVVLAAVAVVAAALVAVATAQRRRLPPPVYPNASLYPPGVAVPVTPDGKPATPPPPADDDPLSHLW